MSSSAPGTWNAHRRPQEPLRSPAYLFKSVAKCSKDLNGSVVCAISERDHFKEIMAEMALLCTEAMRRTSATRTASKPLSLEYIADRLDVDDPCFGYVVRSTEGMLQGFITVTTFTNWQKTFRWDSLHEIAFYYDESDSEGEDDVRHCPKRQRRVDRDGSLARELQQTVRLGDPYNEGIVWPRIAEISLLGALGCGRTLVRLAIEQLEFRKSTGEANYDYVALQATDNSIPFYESIGFTRVGAVTVKEAVSSVGSASTGRPDSRASSSSTESESVDAVPIEPTSPEKANAIAVPSNIVASPCSLYEVIRAGESVADIARRQGVDAWDVVFLNKDLYKGLVPNSRLRKGTMLHLPRPHESTGDDADIAPTKWFVAKENDTPRKIAKKMGLSCGELVAANRNRLPELTSISRLKEGTRVKVSNLDKHDDVCDSYCHWSYPDDTNVEQGEPSYMMVYKLERKVARAPRDVRNSLAVPISAYEPPKLLMPKPVPRTASDINLPQSPRPPPEPLSAVGVFKSQLRDILPRLRENTRENERILDQKWGFLSEDKKSRYSEVASQAKKHYDREYKEYQWEHSKWRKKVARCKAAHATAEKEASLFSRVVTVREDALEGHEYKYWFVLTYIPDLQWCHLAPMTQDGVFGPERKKSQGRPRWKLVDESLGHEVDISSVFCLPVKSKALKRTVDADKEEWDILDGKLQIHDVLAKGDEACAPCRRIRKRPKRARIKPLSGKVAVIPPSAKVRQDSLPELCGSVVSSPTHGPSSRWTPLERRHDGAAQKRNASNSLSPIRQKRRINSSGGRRSVLQL